MSKRTIAYVTADGDSARVTSVEEQFSEVVGATLDMVESPERCRERVRAGDVAAVVAEQSLGDETGVALVSSLREERPDLPLFVYPETVRADLVDAAFEAGATDVVQRTAGDGGARLLARAVDAALEESTRGPSVAPQFHSVADVANDCVVTIDADSVVQYANAAVEDVFGYAPEELRGESLTALMSDDAAAAHLGAVERYLDTGERTLDWEYVELVGRHRDGHEVPLGVSFGEFTTDGDRYFTGVLRDISERRRRERELNERLEQQRAVAEFGQYALDERDIDAVFDRATRLVADHLDHEYCKVLDLDDDGEELRLRAGVGWRDGLVGEATVDADRESQAGFTLLSEEPVVVTDLEGEERFSGPELLTSHDVTSGVSVVVGTPEEPWGILGTHTTERHEYAEHDVQFVQSVANVLATAIERHERELRLRELNEALRQFADAETGAEVHEHAVATARGLLGAPAFSGRYDESEGGFRLAAADGVDASTAGALLGDDPSNPAWRAFVESERLVDAGDGDGESVAIWPLGRHGVLVAVGDRSVDGVTLTDILAANTRSALDRADREEQLRNQRDVLEERTDRLERANRVNRAIREITQALVRADTVEEVYRRVCELLVDLDPYRFAWVAREEPGGGDLVAAASAGAGEDYLDAVETAEGLGPTERAFETGASHVENTVFADPPLDQWRAAALARDFRAAVAIPLAHDDTVHGVLTIYATEQDAFDELEVTVLEELGDTIGYAVHALERRAALVGDSAVELEFRVGDLSRPLLGFVDGSLGAFELESVVQRADGHLHVFFTVEDAAPDAVREAAAASPVVLDSHVVTATETSGVYECALADASPLPRIVDRGVNLHTLRVEDGAASVGLRVPETADVRDFVEAFEEAYGEVDLVSRREVDRPVMSAEEFRNTVRDRLSERQGEVIETAYFSGFFEWPRDCSGQEVAEILGVTQPTVTRHIRAGERELFGLLYDAGHAGEGDAD
ncbi:MAG: bacterio-opsin activator domain-containing protein [Halobacteriaceae archaeon]